MPTLQQREGECSAVIDPDNSQWPISGGSGRMLTHTRTSNAMGLGLS